MNSKIIIFIIAVVILTIGVSVLLIINSGQLGDTTVTPTNLPSGSGIDRGTELPPPGTYGQGASGEIEIVIDEAQSITISDVRTDPETYHMGNGTYSLTGFLNNTPETQFNITFTEADGSFAVALIKEPLAESRKAAEAFLQEKLKVAPETLCELSIYVGVPISINAALSKGNLGISYCPGAFPLE